MYAHQHCTVAKHPVWPGTCQLYAHAMRERVSVTYLQVERRLRVYAEAVVHVDVHVDANLAWTPVDACMQCTVVLAV